jgi:hypothetical protein
VIVPQFADPMNSESYTYLPCTFSVNRKQQWDALRNVVPRCAECAYLGQGLEQRQSHWGIHNQCPKRVPNRWMSYRSVTHLEPTLVGPKLGEIVLGRLCK